jgi:2-methylisocitrate lyase-like PEP mutase family enzyme
MGVAAVIYPRLLTASALRGMMNAMQAFHEEVVANNRTPDQEDLMISFEELNDITGMDALEARYSGGVEVR